MNYPMPRLTIRPLARRIVLGGAILGALVVAFGPYAPPVQAGETYAETRIVRPAINTTVFGQQGASIYWSSSSYAGSPSGAWFVYFYNGFDNYYYYVKTFSGYVRLVRGGQ